MIGCGAGVTAGAVSIDPAVKHETIAEIEPLVPRVVSTYFAEHNFDVVEQSEGHVHIDDARHFLLTTKQKFDAITSDPLDPWVKGAAMLYTREFFELAKQRLNPGGIVTLFVQLYESNTRSGEERDRDVLRSVPEGDDFREHRTTARATTSCSSARPTGRQINLDAMRGAAASGRSTRRSRNRSREIGMHSAVDLFATYAGSADGHEGWLSDAQINRDRNLRLQYLAGRGLNLYKRAIFAEMLPYAKDPPPGLFTGSHERVSLLMQKIHAAHGH